SVRLHSSDLRRTRWHAPRGVVARSKHLGAPSLLRLATHTLARARGVIARSTHPGAPSLLRRATHTLARAGRCGYFVLKAASKEAPGGVMALSFRTNSRPSGAPSSRSMPASSHSTLVGPS